MKDNSNGLSNLFGVCPYLTTQKLLSGKWRIMILFFLNEGTCRFNELSKKMPGVTQASLTKQLRSLEEVGLINREVFPESPPRVEYRPSELGQEFAQVLNAIELFGSTYIKWMADQAEATKQKPAENS